MNPLHWIGYLIDQYRDWRYTRLNRRYRALSKEIELRVHAREGITDARALQAESYLAFLDRRIDLLSARQERISAKINHIYERWNGSGD